LQQRRRFKQKQSLEERLVAQAARLREEASALPPGTERETVLGRAEQAEAAVHMSQWLNLPGSKPDS
jgi:hypothetical protein